MPPAAALRRPPNTLERSTTFVDHASIKGNSDKSYPTLALQLICPVWDVP